MHSYHFYLIFFYCVKIHVLSTVLSTPDSPILVTVSAPESPISEVTVFQSNSAEITRNFSFIPVVKQIHEIKLRGLPETIDPESIRVAGIGGCSIVDVSYNEETNLDSEIITQHSSRWSAREKELLKDLHELETFLESINSEERRDQALEAYVKQYASTAVSNTKKEESNIETIDSILSYTTKRLESIDSNRLVLKQKFIDTQKKIDAIKIELSEVKQNLNVRASLVRHVTVTIDILEIESINLIFRYVVRNASWSSSFDMRVITAENSIKCLYYGQVWQSTGEDWDGVSLTLSTAEPSISANPPPVYPIFVNWKYLDHATYSSDSMINEVSLKAFEVSSDLYGFSSKGVAIDAGGSAMLGAVSYHIEALATISSKALPKKITVGALDLSVDFLHFAVPFEAAAAFVKAKVHNNSEYVLLGSDDVSIFFDNRFVSKTFLDSVSPGEKFNLFLGVDKAVKVTYATPRKMSKQRGMLTKSQCVTCTLCSIITNFKDVPITIAVVDVLPQSTDDLIKVALVEPRADVVEVLRVGDSEVSLVTSTMELIEGLEPPISPTFSIIKVTRNESGKMVWIVYIAPRAEARIPFEFTIEWPSTREIQIN